MTKKEGLEFKDSGKANGMEQNVRLTTEYCAKRELGSGVDYVSYLDTSDGVERKVRLQLDIQTFSSARKADLSAIAFQQFPQDPMKAKDFEDELVLAEALGMQHLDIVNLRQNKPSGVYDSIVYLVNARLGTFGAMSQKTADDAKNVESQG